MSLYVGDLWDREWDRNFLNGIAGTRNRWRSWKIEVVAMHQVEIFLLCLTSINVSTFLDSRKRSREFMSR